MRIERRTDRGIPAYTDDDTFVIGDAEVLVPVGGNRYRPKTDSQHWFIERIADHWRIRTGDGRTLLFGQSEASREVNGGLSSPGISIRNRMPPATPSRTRTGAATHVCFLDEIQYSIFRVRVQYEPRPDILTHWSGRLRAPNVAARHFHRASLRAARTHADAIVFARIHASGQRSIGAAKRHAVGHRRRADGELSSSAVRLLAGRLHLLARPSNRIDHRTARRWAMPAHSLST